MLELLISTVAQGLQWSVMALGVFLTFRVLDIADLSVEGSFPLGAAVAATAIVSGYGVFPLSHVCGLLSRRNHGLSHDEITDPRLACRDSHHDWSLFHQPACDG